MDGRGREMYRKFDGASGDAYVTVLTHDRVQPPTVDTCEIFDSLSIKLGILMILPVLCLTT